MRPNIHGYHESSYREQTLQKCFRLCWDKPLWYPFLRITDIHLSKNTCIQTIYYNIMRNQLMLRHMSLNMRKFETCLCFIVLSKRPRYFQQVTRGKSRATWPAVDWSAFFQIERWGGGRPSNTTGTARASSCSQGFLGFGYVWKWCIVPIIAI